MGRAEDRDWYTKRYKLIVDGHWKKGRFCKGTVKVFLENGAENKHKSFEVDNCQKYSTSKSIPSTIQTEFNKQIKSRRKLVQTYLKELGLYRSSIDGL